MYSTFTLGSASSVSVISKVNLPDPPVAEPEVMATRTSIFPL